MAESQHPIDIELQKLTLEDTDHIGSTVSDEYHQVLKEFLSVKTQVDFIIDSRATAVWNHFQICIKRVGYLSEIVFLCITPVTFDKGKFKDMKETTLTYYTHQFRPLLLFVWESREWLTNKVRELQLEQAPNLNVVKDALLRSQQLLIDLSGKVVDCESKLSRVKEYLCEVGNGFFSPEFLVQEQEFKKKFKLV